MQGTAERVAAILGLRAQTRPLLEAVRRGLPVSSFGAVASYANLTREALADASAISLRTIQRRKSPARLHTDESDRLTRVARIYAYAEDVFASREAANGWMHAPNRALDGARPLDMLDTEVAAREVEDLLGRIDDGSFA
jgi:putative toxin-antitoxin system antitoxin component (TIGR02293 family)